MKPTHRQNVSLPAMLLLVISLVINPAVSSKPCHAGEATIDGELLQWHKVTLTVDGPEASEDGTPNPFLDYRMQVEFEHPQTGTTYSVPGYFAADGDAANSSANSGNKWRAHLSPDHVGVWTYKVSFRSGTNVAVSDQPDAGESVVGADGITGKFEIGPTDKQGRDFRAHGRLKYVGKHHLQFAQTGKFFLKAGVDAPENFLAYQDFDGDFKTDGHKDELVKDWEPHVQDWQPGDPTWQNEKGKGIIGAINYLASQGLNVFSFLTLNIEGDDRNVFPYTAYDQRERIDCSRMDQWEIVLAHGTQQGMYLHFKTQEAENVKLLDNGDLGTERKLYYRELIARFGHHLALNWNLGEEVGLGHKVSTEQKVAWANYFRNHDPYHHHMVIHNGDDHFDLLGDASELTGFSLQTNKADFRNVHGQTLTYLQKSAEAGKPWVVACDEPGDATHALITDEEDPTRDNARKNALWGNIMAGGAGVEWYFGYKHPHSDLTCQDYRVRQKMWEQCRTALEFFEKQKIPFWEMSNANSLLGTENGYCLTKPGELYLAYLKLGEPMTLDLSGVDGVFEVMWFNPRDGGDLQVGSNEAVNAGQKVNLGNPPAQPDQDWLAALRPGNSNRDYAPYVSAGINQTSTLLGSKKKVSLKLEGDASHVGKSGGELTTAWSKQAGPGKVEFEDAASLTTNVTIHGSGEYVLALRVGEGNQEAQSTVTINITEQPTTLQASKDFKFVVSDGFVPGYQDKKQRAMAIDARKHKGKFAAAESKFQGKEGIYDLVLTTLTEIDGESVYRLLVSGKKIGEVKNPKTKEDYRPVEHRFEDVSIKPGDTIRVEFNSDSNGEIPEGDAFAFARGRWRSVTIVRPDVQLNNQPAETTNKAAAVKSEPKPFDYVYDASEAKKVHKQTNGIVVVEAEDYDAVDRQDHRKWHVTTTDNTPDVKPDPDPNHADGASKGAYLELLPDTRVTHADPLVKGVSFCNTPGQCSVLYYPIEFTEPGRYHVWVRMNCTGSEDNGLHVGLDGEWPTSGARLQFTGHHGKWQWDSRQRTTKVHVGEFGKIWLDIKEPGLHTVMFSMREDGFEFDRFLLSKELSILKSKSLELGPPTSPRR
jgi:hypothetical protein